MKPSQRLQTESISGIVLRSCYTQMRACCRSSGALVLSIGMLLLDGSTFASQTPSAEYQVKAAFLYNFAKFVEWPAQAFPRANAPFAICLAGDSFEGELEKLVEGENLDGRPLQGR